MKEQRAGVGAAVELLQEETGKLLNIARRQGAEAYQRGDTATFDRIDRECQELEAFAQQVEALAERWRTFVSEATAAAGLPATRTQQQEPIPEKDYALPILRILDEAGGSASIEEVRAKIERELGRRFGPAELDALKSGMTRWNTRLQAARQKLKNAGLVSSKSPPGTWEITDKGRTVIQSGDIDEALSTRRNRRG